MTITTPFLALLSTALILVVALGESQMAIQSATGGDLRRSYATHQEPVATATVTATPGTALSMRCVFNRYRRRSRSRGTFRAATTISVAPLALDLLRAADAERRGWVHTLCGRELRQR